MNCSKLWLFAIVICLVICVEGCRKDSSEKSLNTFFFEASNNPGLTFNIFIQIDSESGLITTTLPVGVNIRLLVASFSFTGKQVTVNNVKQISGVTVNDFSSPVEYVVTAEDNSIRRYSVELKVVTHNTITSFEFWSYLNPGLSGDVKAIILNDSIIADLPINTPTSSLVASFSSLAASVTVDKVRQISGVSRNDFSSTVQYVVEGTDGSKRIYKAVVRANTSFTKFWIKKSLNPGLSQDIVFDIDNKNLKIEASYLRWINSEKPSRMVVSFEAPGASVTTGGVVIQNGEVTVNFSQPVQFTTVCGNSAPRTYTVNFICPQMNANLPVLRIEADAPIKDKVNYVTAKLEIQGNGINKGLWDFNREKIEIRLRGNSTMWLPKKPYRIKFPEKYSPLGLNHAKEKSWVLLANDCDKSLIRNAVAFKISEIVRSGADYRKFTPCNQFVDLYLNGMYDGVYHLTDQVQAAPGRVNVQTLTASDAGDASKISGGYLLEMDGFANGEPLWFGSPRGLKLSIKHPDDDDYAQEQVKWITNYFTMVENVLFSSDFKHPTNGWRKYIDINSWVDHYIINEMAGNSDAWWQLFLSKERDVDYFVMGPVWDFDIAFNNDNRINNATNRLMAEAAHDPKVWISRFMQDETFKAAVKRRWNEKKDELARLPKYVDELALLLDMSQKANFKRWNINQQALGHANPAPASYQEAINQLKNYLNTRHKYLDTEFNKW